MELRQTGDGIKKNAFFEKIAKKVWRYKFSLYLCTRNQEMIDASLAQLVEHDTLNVGVQGSSP